MRHFRWAGLSALLIVGIASAQPVPVAADGRAAASREAPVAVAANVRFRGQVLFTVANPIGELSVETRA